MNITSGGLFATSQYVGDLGAGGITQSGGYNFASNLYLGYGSGASGTYTLSGSGQLAANSAQYVAYSGSGSFIQSGGSNFAPSLYLGFNSGSTGTYSLSGTGLLSTPTQYVGYSGTGSFTQTGGSNANWGSLYLGANAVASGAYAQSGGSDTIAGSLYVGNNSAATAAYTLSGTGQLSAPNEYLAPASGAKASLRSPAARTRPPTLPSAPADLLAHRRCAASQRRHREPGRLRRRQQPGLACCRRHPRSDQRHLEEPLRPVAEHGGQARC